MADRGGEVNPGATCQMSRLDPGRFPRSLCLRVISGGLGESLMVKSGVVVGVSVVMGACVVILLAKFFPESDL